MNSEIYWQAVKNKDERFDGAFFYAVKTTAIFCKPSCSSKLPKRENVEFFESFLNAEKAGFRACLRCCPKEKQAVNPQIETVLRVCELLETEEEIKLENLGRALGFNAHYLQKTFKQIVGVSPKKFAESQRIKRFKEQLKKGESVTSAIYEAGYGSSRSLYEKVSEKLGMTPKIYQKGGKGMKIEYAIADCNLGKVLVGQTSKGVCSVAFGDDESILRENLQKEFFEAELSLNRQSLEKTVKEILRFLEGQQQKFSLPLDIRATAFQMQVWEILQKIPYGQTLSYKQVAEKLGNPRAVRAVARACAGNRVAVVIPCHRVVGSSGDLSGYRWGIERKRDLLNLEKNFNK